MKVFIFASALSLVGSCATKRYSEKIQDIKDNIVFENSQQIKEISKTIDSSELKKLVYDLSYSVFQGRKTGELGYHKASNYIKDYYINEAISSPLGENNYYQQIPESFFSDDIKSSQNVISYIKGTEYPDEVIIISAHLDHEGVKEDQVYYGADDNASGTAALMEIAQAFKIAQKKGFGPKRSIAFLHLTGEEIGLKGSTYYTDHPVFSLKNTVANLNMDMIGRVDEKHIENPEYIYVIGDDRLSTELHYISEIANDTFTNLELEYELNKESDINRYYYRSDHYNFALKGIPVIFYFNGEHEDYHKPTDTPDKINYPLLQKRTQLIFTTAWYLANSKNRIVADKK